MPNHHENTVPPDSRYRLYLYWFLCLAVCLSGTWFSDFILMNHDMSSITAFSQGMLEGKRIYVDLITSQPPLVLYICMIPLGIHAVTGLSIPHAFLLFIFCLLQGGMLFGWKIARRNALCRTQEEAYAILFAFCCGLFILPLLGQSFLGAFGQREHMFCALSLPYIMLMLNRLQGNEGSRSEKIAAGIMGTVGFCVKPQFLLFFVLSELFLMIERRKLFTWLRIDAVIVIVLSCMYALFIVLVTPEYIQLIPRFIHDYAGYESPLALVSSAAYLAIIFPVIIIIRMRYSEHIKILLYLLLLIGGGEVIYLAPKLPYFYHLLPAYFLSLNLFVFARLAAGDKKFARWVVITMRILAGVACLAIAFQALVVHKFFYEMVLPAAVLPLLFVAVARFVSQEKRRAFMAIPLFFTYLAFIAAPVDLKHFIGRREETLAEAKLISPYKTILAFNSDNLFYFPMTTYAGADWGMTTVYLEYLPDAYSEWRKNNPVSEPPYHTVDEMADNERFFHEKVIKDLQRLPDAIIIDEGSLKAGFGFMKFDYLQYFMLDPRFREVWSHYEFVTRFLRRYNNITKEPTDSYDAIYRRKN